VQHFVGDPDLGMIRVTLTAHRSARMHYAPPLLRLALLFITLQSGVPAALAVQDPAVQDPAAQEIVLDAKHLAVTPQVTLAGLPSQADLQRLQQHNTLVIDVREAAERVIGMKRDFKSVANKAAKHLTERLNASEKNRLNTFNVEMDMNDKLQRIYCHAAHLIKCTISILEADTPKRG